MRLCSHTLFLLSIHLYPISLLLYQLKMQALSRLRTQKILLCVGRRKASTHFGFENVPEDEKSKRGNRALEFLFNIKF